MKKILNNYYIIVALLLLPAIQGCDEGFEEMNVDPNQPTEVPVGFLLTSTQAAAVDDIWDEWQNGRFGMVYSQYWAQNEYTDEDRYLLRQGQNNNFWTFWYAGHGTTSGSEVEGGGIINLQTIINQLNERLDNDEVSSENIDMVNNQIAIARIFKVWMFQIVTDIYGDVPYFNAFQGAEQFSPSYDRQEAIYTDMLKELTEANDQINIEAESYGTADLIYNGDMEMWKKFCNSLKLRVAIRIADVKADEASTAIKEAVAAGVFESNADDALLRYLASPPNNNPLNEARKSRPDFAVSLTFTDKLNELNDPRLPAYAEPAANTGLYQGITYGLTRGEAAAIPLGDVSQPNPSTYAAEAPGILLTYSEVQFILAEAAQRGFITGSPATFYDEGIRASMEFWGVDDQVAVNDYINRNPYNAGSWQTSIGIQKWIALYMQGIQGWIEYRRLDFGVLRLPAGGIPPGVTTNNVPTRVNYPTDEQNLNNENYQQAVAAQGPDRLDTQVWWDVN